MQTVALGMSINGIPLSSNSTSKLPFSSRLSRSNDQPFLSHPPNSGMRCRASQVAEFFPTVSPNIVVREAKFEDSWEVAETHCSSFFPEYSFPLDFLLRINRMLATSTLSTFTIPNGCQRTCLVAVIDSSGDDTFLFGNEDFEVGGRDSRSVDKGYVVGILTVDTMANFLPRKGPLRQRRTKIAYISNVAVRERFRQKGVAKRLVAKAEAQARSWGCHAIALHYDINNPAATKLYIGQGYRCIKVPEGAKWPQPKTAPDVQFRFMMKRLSTRTKNEKSLSESTTEHKC